jgi:hypothetical protein
MQINWNAIGEKIYSILKGSAKSVSIYDAKGNSTIDPSEATRFFANLPSHNKKLQNITILVACHDEGHDSHLTIKTPNVKDQKDFAKIHQIRNHIKKAIGDREGLKINWHVFDHAINPKDEVINNVKNTVNEGMIGDMIKYWWNKTKLNSIANKLMKMLESDIPIKTEKLRDGVWKIIFIDDNEWPIESKDLISRKLGSVFYTHFDQDGNLIVRLKSAIHEETAVSNIKESKDVSKVYGTTKSSFQQIGEAKLIIRHSDAVNENVHGARSRKIKALFVENKIGERFAYPHLHVTGARAFARHISNGGTNHDTVANKLYSLSEDYIKLRRTANSLRLNESANDVWVERLKESMNEINRKLKSMHGPKGYKNVTASMLEETASELDETFINNLRDQIAECCGCPCDSQGYDDVGTAAKYIAAKGPVPEPVTFVWNSRPDITSKISEFTSVAERLNWQLNELASACANAEATSSLQSIAEQIANGVMPNESDLNLIRRAYESSQKFVSEEVTALPEESELNEYLETFSEDHIFAEDATKPVYDAIWNSINTNHQDLINQYGMKNVANAVNYETEQLSRVTQFDSNSVNVWIKNIISTLENLTRKKYHVNEGDGCNMTAEGEYCPVHGMEECMAVQRMSGVNPAQDGNLDELTTEAMGGFGDDDSDLPDDDDFEHGEDDDDYYDDRDYDDDDRSHFADPHGHSALRAATPDNPRIHSCPTCGHPNRLTVADIAQGYQCDKCADAAEQGREIDYYNDPTADNDLEGEAEPLQMDKDDLYESQVARLKNLAGL